MTGWPSTNMGDGLPAQEGKRRELATAVYSQLMGWLDRLVAQVRIRLSLREKRRQAERKIKRKMDRLIFSRRFHPCLFLKHFIILSVWF